MALPALVLGRAGKSSINCPAISYRKKEFVVGNFSYVAPPDLESLLAVKAREKEKALLLAGGSNLVVYIKDRVIREGTIVDVSNLKELAGIRLEAGRIFIGAGETLTRILESPLIHEHIPFLSEALRQFANPLVRNMSTIGGNIADASPIADSAPLLLVLDAEVKIAGQGGRRTVPLNEFFISPRRTRLAADEVITGFSFAVPERGTGKFLKLGLRRGTACAVTSVAVWLIAAAGKVGDIRIALGGVAPRPIRAVKTEKRFRGQELTPERIAELAPALKEELSPIDDVRGSAAYRRAVSVRLLARAVRLCAGMEE
jgi:CO/xanthine dehydrogenase FAD-binding subunit